MRALTAALLRFALVTGTSDECEDGEVAVLDEDTGAVQGCYPDEAAANEAIAASNDSGPSTDTAADLPARAVMVIATEGEMTADRRIVEPGALTWRDLPLALTINHDPDRIAGSVRAIGRTDTPESVTVDGFDAEVGDEGRFVMGLIEFDLDIEDGRYASGRVGANADGPLRGVSMEVGDEQVEFECVEEDEDGFCVQDVMRLHAGRIGAVTLAPFQAIESAVVTATDLAPVAAGLAFRVSHDPGLAASSSAPSALIAAAVPAVPPSDWFTVDLDGPTPLTITDEGRVYGHLALWGTCHTGIAERCITPPEGDDFAMFHLGAVLTDAGEVAVGKITMNTGHQALYEDGTRRPIGWAETIAHYDHTGTQAAYVRAGEDKHGIWLAGTLAPTATEDDIRALRAAQVSGDWRPIRGRLSLMAALAVNVPGFPVPRTRSLVAAGEPLALVAAAGPVRGGCGCHDTPSSSLVKRVATLEAVVASLGLADQAADALAASIARPT